MEMSQEYVRLCQKNKREEGEGKEGTGMEGGAGRRLESDRKKTRDVQRETHSNAKIKSIF